MKPYAFRMFICVCLRGCVCVCVCAHVRFRYACKLANGNNKNFKKLSHSTGTKSKCHANKKHCECTQRTRRRNEKWKIYGKIIKWMKNDSTNESHVDACIVIFTTLWHVNTLVSLSIWRLYRMPHSCKFACNATHAYLLAHSLTHSPIHIVLTCSCLFVCFVGLFVFMLECNRSVCNSTIPFGSV